MVPARSDTGTSPHSPFHVPVAGKPDLLDDLAEVMERHGLPPRYAERARQRAAMMRKTGLTPLTGASPVEDLVAHGVDKPVVPLLRQEGIDTVGQLCDRDAEQLVDIRNIDAERIAQISAVLARFNMGLRPNPVR